MSFPIPCVFLPSSKRHSGGRKKNSFYTWLTMKRMHLDICTTRSGYWRKIDMLWQNPSRRISNQKCMRLKKNTASSIDSSFQEGHRRKYGRIFLPKKSEYGLIH